MNAFMKMLVLLLFAYITQLVMGFAGVDVGIYISYLLWFIALGLFLIMLPETLPSIIS
jgi:hypothetical protein